MWKRVEENFGVATRGDASVAKEEPRARSLCEGPYSFVYSGSFPSAGTNPPLFGPSTWPTIIHHNGSLTQTRPKNSSWGKVGGDSKNLLVYLILGIKKDVLFWDFPQGVCNLDISCCISTWLILNGANGLGNCWVPFWIMINKMHSHLFHLHQRKGWHRN
jgi:hypothetical protein